MCLVICNCRSCIFDTSYLPICGRILVHTYQVQGTYVRSGMRREKNKQKRDENKSSMMTIIAASKRRSRQSCVKQVKVFETAGRRIYVWRTRAQRQHACRHYSFGHAVTPLIGPHTLPCLLATACCCVASPERYLPKFYHVARYHYVSK